jgi:hypothetical protein
MNTDGSIPRYDRIVSLVLLVLLSMAVVFLIDINPNIIRARLGGDLPVITVSWLILAAIVILVSSGADLFTRDHPQVHARPLWVVNLGFTVLELAPGFWILPALSVVTTFTFFRLFSGGLQMLAFVLALIATGILLLATLVAQHYSMDRQPDIRQIALTVLQGLALLMAFGLFSAIYYARLRTLYSATMVASIGTLLAYAQLQWTLTRANLWILSLVVGLILAQTLWALNYWAAPFLLGGALLLVIFYVVVGMLQNALSERSSNRAYYEYAIIGSLLMISIIWAVI